MIARSDQGRLPVRPERLEAGMVLARVAGRFQTRARAEQRPLEADPSAGVELHADPARVEQALANLVDNALTYGEGPVVLSARTHDGQVELHVRDAGSGFPEEFLPRAFERFTRADEARTRGGTGLGLAIAAAIAGAHGGSAHAENVEGGADVWITLPSDETLSSSPHRLKARCFHTYPEEPFMRVLVVEDEIKMASLIRRGLRSEGLAADVAIKGEDALWMAGSTGYDAIVLDVMLPGIDGFETCRRLREEGIWSPVIMLTARDTVEDRVAGLDGGADDYLAKPFSFAELLARLRALARRGPVERPAVLEVGTLKLDPAGRRVWRSDTEVSLSAKEFQLLETFMRHPGEVLSRYQLLEHAWDYDYENRSNIVDVYVRYLRDKIDRPFGVNQLETVRGAGYRLRDESHLPPQRTT